MNFQTKNRLIALYLRYKFGSTYESSWLDNIENYLLLGEAIERIDDWGPDFLKLSQLGPTDPEFKVFLAILDDAIKFSSVLPPICKHYDEEALDRRMELEESMWMSFPNANYTQREASFLPENNDGFQRLKKEATAKLLSLVKEQCPYLKLDSLDKLTTAIETHEKQLAKEKDIPTQQKIAAELNLLKDLNKIVRLELINIPKSNGRPAIFCALAETVGGVTEKLSLIDLDTVKEKLGNIQQKDKLIFSEYTNKRNDFKLAPQGILKLPKHGKTVEVQREVIALNISRILGFSTTHSNMVKYNGKAALFVPFDDIQLLQEFAKGEEKSTILPSSISLKGFKKIGDKYYHYSTVIPVGNGLNCDRFIEDFGKIEAYGHLCNDTDFIGMHNQNKGIKDGKYIYIFDQIIMDSEKLELDTRFNLFPVGMTRHSRHNQGRNRTIIEDSSFDTKVESIVHLLKNTKKINIMLDNVWFTHQANINKIQNKINELEKSKKPSAKKEIEQLQIEIAELRILREDASHIKSTINNRITTMFKNFPELNGKAITPAVFFANTKLIKQSLLLEKLVNNPVLFTKDGRPYKHPSTYRNTNTISSIRENNGVIRLSFTSLDGPQMAHILRKSSVNPELYKIVENTLVIATEELAKITETDLFPALRDFNQNEHYLNIEDLRYIAQHYPEEKPKRTIPRIQQYQYELMTAKSSIAKANAMKSVLNDIQKYGASEKNKEFLKHVELNLQMDIQKQLRKLIHEEHNDNNLDEQIAKAFDAAVKLDRLNDFNQVLIAFAKKPGGNKNDFMVYLLNCILRGDLATNYNQGKIESQLMQKESFALFKQITSGKSKSSSVKMLDLMSNDEDSLEKHEEEKEGKEENLEFHMLDEKDFAEIEAFLNILEKDRDNEADTQGKEEIAPTQITIFK